MTSESHLRPTHSENFSLPGGRPAGFLSGGAAAATEGAEQLGEEGLPVGPEDLTLDLYGRGGIGIGLGIEMTQGKEGVYLGPCGGYRALLCVRACV